MSEESVLITGANRGLGLGFVEVFLKRGYQVYAGVRDTADPTSQALENLLKDQGKVLHIDVRDRQTIQRARNSVEKIDILINNAGVGGSFRSILENNDSELNEVWDVNTLGAFRVTQIFWETLSRPNGKIVFISSLMGSIEDNRSGGYTPYRVSKAALNMLGKNFSFEAQKAGNIVLILHPGWVKTRMGGSEAPLSVEESVRGMVEVILKARSRDNGRFLDYRGRELPW